MFVLGIMTFRIKIVNNYIFQSFIVEKGFVS